MSGNRLKEKPKWLLEPKLEVKFNWIPELVVTLEFKKEVQLDFEPQQKIDKDDVKESDSLVVHKK